MNNDINNNKEEGTNVPITISGSTTPEKSIISIGSSSTDKILNTNDTNRIDLTKESNDSTGKTIEMKENISENKNNNDNNIITLKISNIETKVNSNQQKLYTKSMKNELISKSLNIEKIKLNNLAWNSPPAQKPDLERYN